jgi:hypothetical protein
MSQKNEKTLDDIYQFLLDHWPRVNKNQEDIAKSEYFPKKRKEAEKETANDLAKTTERLLTDIHDESLDDQTRDRAMTVSRTIARFAALLVVLSNQAGRVSRENMTLQNKLVRLTWGLFWLTLALTFVGAVQLYSLLK